MTQIDKLLYLLFIVWNGANKPKKGQKKTRAGYLNLIEQCWIEKFQAQTSSQELSVNKAINVCKESPLVEKRL